MTHSLSISQIHGWKGNMRNSKKLENNSVFYIYQYFSKIKDAFDQLKGVGDFLIQIPLHGK
jgi:hypothetical protein